MKNHAYSGFDIVSNKIIRSLFESYIADIANLPLFEAKFEKLLSSINGRTQLAMLIIAQTNYHVDNFEKIINRFHPNVSSENLLAQVCQIIWNNFSVNNDEKILCSIIALNDGKTPEACIYQGSNDERNLANALDLLTHNHIISRVDGNIEMLTPLKIQFNRILNSQKSLEIKRASINWWLSCIDDMSTESTNVILIPYLSQILHMLSRILKYREDSNIQLITSISNKLNAYYRFDLESSREYLETVLSFAQENNAESLKACALVNLGEYYYYRDHFNQSLEYYNQAEILYRSLDDQRSLALTLKNLGELLRWRYNYVDSMQYFKEAETIYEKHNDILGKAHTLKCHGDACKFCYQYVRALELYSIAKICFLNINNDLGLAHILRSMSEIYGLQGYFAKAFSLAEKAARIYRSFSDKLKLAYTLKNVADFHRWKSNTLEALNTYKKANILFRKAGDRLGKAHALRGIGETWRIIGNYAKAIIYLNLSQRIFEQLNEYHALGKIYFSKSLIASKSNQFTIAREYITIAKSYARQAKDKLGIARSLRAQCDIILSKSNSKQSLELIDQAESIYKQIDDIRDRGYNQLSRGNIAFMEEEFHHAYLHYIKAEQLFEHMTDLRGLAMVKEKIDDCRRLINT